MAAETAKIRLKLGSMEIEYEGTEAFLRDELFNLLEKAASFVAEHGLSSDVDPPLREAANGKATADFDHSTSAMAAHLGGGGTGTELIMAAAAHLTFAQKKEKFTRREINNEIRSAHPFYKDSMTSNLSKSLNSLVRVKRLNPIGRDTYSLSAGERTAVGAKLARTS